MSDGIENHLFETHVGLEKRVRVLVAIRSEIARAGIRALLETKPDMDIVAAGAELTVELLRLEPEVVLVDAESYRLGQLFMPANNAAVRPGSIRVVLYLRDDPSPDALAGMGMAGVDCVVLRDDAMDDIVNALRSAHRGSGWVSPTVGAALLRSRVRPGGSNPAPSGELANAALTSREQAVLPLVADGLTDQEIGKRLHLSVRAVKYHLSNLLAKFNARNRAHLVNLAFRAQLL